MTTWPIGDAHPFPRVHALALAEGIEGLDLTVMYDGKLIRLHDNALQIVFRRNGDPASAVDRQSFDYFTHISIDAQDPRKMLDEIKDHIAAAKTARKGETDG
ncbi:hypothetical protein [Halovulum sp. GXIMD14793]